MNPPPPTPLSPKNFKLLRTIELLLVIAVAFSSSIFSSIYVILTGYQRDRNIGDVNVPLTFGNIIIVELSAIAVLAYVLFRQGRNLSQIGLSFRWKDIPRSIFLTIFAYLATIVGSWVIHYGYYFATKKVLNQIPMNIDFMPSEITALAVLTMLVNPVFEELIVRAYTISELEYLTNRKSLAIIVSVILQTSYHLYQGWGPAISLIPTFLVFSLYYLKSKRILPIILAHAYFDLIALIYYAQKL